MVFWLVFVDLGSFVSGIFRLGWFDFGAGLDVVGFRSLGGFVFCWFA